MSHVFGRAGIFRVTANRGCLDLGTSHAASLGSDDSTEARVAAGSGNGLVGTCTCVCKPSTATRNTRISKPAIVCSELLPVPVSLNPVGNQPGVSFPTMCRSVSGTSCRDLIVPSSLDIFSGSCLSIELPMPHYILVFVPLDRRSNY